jgi:HlyD family secretion protein
VRFSPVIALFAVAAAALGLAAAPPSAPAASGTPRSGAEPVLEHCLVSVLKEAKVPAREGGVLIDLLVREGDSIKAGDVIAKIDASQPQFERRKAKAEHDQAVAKASSDVDVRFAVASELVAAAEYEKAQLSNDRLQGSVTRVELDRLELNERKAELQIEQAELERKMTALAADSKQVEVDAAENAIELAASLKAKVARLEAQLKK